MAELILKSEEGRETRHIFDSYVSVGRSSRCDIAVKDRKLSRIHAEIVRVDEDFILVDLRSQNGTKVNSRRIFEAVLQDGDVITLGRIEMKFLRSGIPAPK